MIAILGATGYIGRSLARHIAAASDQPLVLFARSPERLAGDELNSRVTARALDQFNAADFDLVVNAIGAGDPARVRALGGSILDISDIWDRRVTDCMGARTRYVFLSSGAIYGASEKPADEDSELRLPVNRLAAIPAYTLAKLCAEARHRQMPERSILDLRIFSYADSMILIEGSSFLAELAHSVAARTPFHTSPVDMIRDYAGAQELWDLICGWRSSGAPNLPADLYSAEPVGKLALLAVARERYGLKVEMGGAPADSPTGRKPVYASRFRIAETFGYSPRRTSLQIVLALLDRLHAEAALTQR